MARLPLSRAVCLVLLLLLSVSSALLAAGDRPGQKAPKPAAAGVLSQAWARMARLFGALGSEMDPDGRYPVLATGDNGSTMDPNGRLKPAAPTGDLGSTMDPDGAK
jgi:hypothetical protein